MKYFFPWELEIEKSQTSCLPVDLSSNWCFSEMITQVFLLLGTKITFLSFCFLTSQKWKWGFFFGLGTKVRTSGVTDTALFLARLDIERAVGDNFQVGLRRTSKGWLSAGSNTSFLSKSFKAPGLQASGLCQPAHAVSCHLLFRCAEDFTRIVIHRIK